MPSTLLEEIEVVVELKKHACILRKAKDPRRSIAAAKWEIRLEEELAGLEKQREAAEHAQAA